MEMAQTGKESPELLSPLEVRVLGCLIEKELTTPDVYPLTLNSLVNAVNQRNNRQPILAASSADVELALDGLRRKQLVSCFSGADSRVAKYKHLIAQMWPLENMELALFDELLLRGPQTTAELRSRAERMMPMPATVQEVEEILSALSKRFDRPLIGKLSRQSGQKGERWVQLLSGEPAVDQKADEPITVLQTVPPWVEQRVAALEAEVGKLRAELDELRKSLGGV